MRLQEIDRSMNHCSVVLCILRLAYWCYTDIAISSMETNAGIPIPRSMVLSAEVCHLHCFLHIHWLEIFKQRIKFRNVYLLFFFFRKLTTDYQRGTQCSIYTSFFNVDVLLSVKLYLSLTTQIWRTDGLCDV